MPFPEKIKVHHRIDQAKIINIFNCYVEWQNFPFYFNEDGVCNGLSTMHAKYVLEKREAEFFKRLEQITKLTSYGTIDVKDHDHINRFCCDILVTAFPEAFDRRYRQGNAMQLIPIEHKSPSGYIQSKYINQPIFNMSIVGSIQESARAITCLQIEVGEVLRLDVPGHAVSVHKLQNGYYRYYDPNNPNGVDDFRSSDLLIKRIKSQYYKSNSLFGMSLKLFRTPYSDSQRKYPLPDKDYILEHILDEKKIVKKVCSAYGLENNLLSMGCQHGISTTELAYILNAIENNQEVRKEEKLEMFRDAAISAAQYNHPNAFQIISNKLYQLLDAESKKEFFKKILNTVLFSKSNSCYEVLLLDETFHNFLSARLLSKAETKKMLFVLLAHPDVSREGKRQSLLDIILQQFNTHPLAEHRKFSLTEVIFELDEQGENLITAAVKSGSMANLRKILDYSSVEHQFSFQEQLYLLKTSILANQPRMVEYFLKKLDQDFDYRWNDAVLTQLNLTFSNFKKMHIQVLTALHESNYPFSKEVEVMYHKRAAIGCSIREGFVLFIANLVDWITSILRKESLVFQNTSTLFQEPVRLLRENVRVEEDSIQLTAPPLL